MNQLLVWIQKGTRSSRYLGKESKDKIKQRSWLLTIHGWLTNAIEYLWWKMVYWKKRITKSRWKMVHRYNKDTQQNFERSDWLVYVQGISRHFNKRNRTKVGITQPNLYHYFGDKEKLYTAVLENHLKDVGKALRNRSNKRNGISSNLDKMAQFWLRHIWSICFWCFTILKAIFQRKQEIIFLSMEENYREPLKKSFSKPICAKKWDFKEIAARHFS